MDRAHDWEATTVPIAASMSKTGNTTENTIEDREHDREQARTD